MTTQVDHVEDFDLEAHGNHVILKEITPEERSVKGIIIPETAWNRSYGTGIVVTSGDKTSVRTGQKVMYVRGIGVIEIGNERFVLTDDEHIIGVFKE